MAQHVRSNPLPKIILRPPDDSPLLRLGADRVSKLRIFLDRLLKVLLCEGVQLTVRLGGYSGRALLMLVQQRDLTKKGSHLDTCIKQESMFFFGGGEWASVTQWDYKNSDHRTPCTPKKDERE